jgi:hypothetical protein
MSLSDWAASLRKRLAPHVTQLRRSLTSLGERVRQSLASTVGRTVADAVTEAVEAALASPVERGSYYPPVRSSPAPSRERDWWGDPGGSSWGQHRGYDDYGRPYADDHYDRDSYDEDADRERSETHDKPCQGRLTRSLAAGCRAAAWWLERHPGRFSLLLAAGIGLAAGVAAFFSGSTFIGVTGAAASALTLLALTDTLRCAAAALGATP